MEFLRVNASREFLAQIKTRFEAHYGGRVLIMDADHRIPRDVQEQLTGAGIIGLIPADDGVTFASLDQAVYRLIGEVQKNPAIVNDLAGHLRQFTQFASQIGSSWIHNVSVANKYLNAYRQLRGHFPRACFEAGVGCDHVGQLFACGVHGCTFHGVSPENGPSTDISVITSLMNILDFSVDLKRFEGTVTYNSALQQLPVAGAYDLVYSHVVLEHVHDPVGFIRHARNMLTPDGLFISTIDLTGHSYGDHPWSFLELSDEEFRARITNTGDFVANRLRFADYLRIFAEEGLRVAHTEIPMRMQVPVTLTKRWNTDLSVGMVLFACMREKSERRAA